jgi:SAM-dependent methyltransferase
MRCESLHDWFSQPLGSYLLERERLWLDQVVPDIFGYHAIQLGFPQFDLLRESRIVHRVTVAPAAVNEVKPHVQAQFHELPFEPQSIDLCVLPHVLEFTELPHEILREIDRVMRPEGRILILGFNPWSLFGVRRLWSSQGYPWQGQFVSLVRMKDWLQLLGFEPSSGRLTCYIPPCDTAKWQQRWQFLEKAGDRWWGVSGGVYMLEAIKRVQGMRLIMPAWSEQKAKERKFAAVANRGVFKSDRTRFVGEAEDKPHPNLRLVK